MALHSSWSLPSLSAPQADCFRAAGVPRGPALCIRRRRCPAEGHRLDSSASEPGWLLQRVWQHFRSGDEGEMKVATYHVTDLFIYCSASLMGMCPKRLLTQRSSGSPASLRCSVVRSVIRRG